MVTAREVGMSSLRRHHRRPWSHLWNSARSLPSRVPKPERYPLSHVAVRMR
jgi:hypothetical protein